MAGNVGDLNILMAVLDSATRAADMFKERITKEKETLLERSIKTAEETLHRESGEV
jgi:F0F1-type ATP synthase membrane subunit b/b'